MAEMEEERFSLAERLKELRTSGRRGKISQESLAMEAGISVVTYMKIEQGYTKTPSFLTVWKICEALGYSLDELVNKAKPTN